MKLKLGNSYVNRDGYVVLIIEYQPHAPYPYVDDEGTCYDPHGYVYSPENESARDLVKLQF